MRNLKRALSLGMASVMLMGMMVVGASAKGIEDFSDSKAIKEAGSEISEAVAITGAIKIFEGYEDGSFGGDRVVTRAEMAVIIAKMLYGADVTVNQFTNTKVFTDVPEWAEGYINLCASLGIVVGVGDKKFNPNATVTTAEAATMLGKALGYFQNESDFGDNWMLAATSKATSLGLYGNLKLTATAGLTRNHVAVMVFNTLTEAVPVEYNQALGIYYNTNNTNNNNSAGWFSIVFNYLETLGYKNFDLVYKTVTRADDFGRPGKTWGTGSYRSSGTTNKDGSLINSNVTMTANNEIITVVAEADYKYTGTVKENVIYNDMGKDTIDNVNWGSLYVDGKDEGTAKPSSNDKDTTYNGSAKGSVTEFFLVDGGNKMEAVQYFYYMAEINRVRTDSKGTYVTISNNSTYSKLDVADYYTSDFAKGDVVMVTVGYNNDDDYYIASMEKLNTVEGKVTAVKTTTSTTEDSYIHIDGTKYDLSKMFNQNFENAITKADFSKIDLKGISYKAYVDPNGYVLGLVELEATAAKYLYVERMNASLGDFRAKVVFADGTKTTIDVHEDSRFWNGTKFEDLKVTTAEANGYDGMVFEYTVNSKGVYTLTYAGEQSASGLKIERKQAYITLTGATYRVSVDADTLFIDISNGKVYTGYEAVPSYENVTLAYNSIDEDGAKNSLADVVFIVKGDAKDNTYFYLVKNDARTETYEGKKYNVYTEAYVNGVKTNVWVDVNEGKLPVGLYKVNTTHSEGYAKDVTLVTTATAQKVETRGSSTMTMADGTTTYTFNNDTVFVVVDKKPTQDKASVYEGGYNDIIEVRNENAGDKYVTYVDVLKADNDRAELVYIYFIYNP